jgi:hypothetical protein
MSTRTRHTARRITLAVVKDLILFAVGTGILVRQGFFTASQDANWTVMVVGAAIANVPAARYLWALRSGSIGGLSSEPEDSSPSPPSF